MKLYAAMLGLTILIGAGSAEAATTLVSGSLTFLAGDLGACEVVNAAGHELQIDITLVDADGTEFPLVCGAVEPGHTCRHPVTAAGSLYCKVTVTGGGKDSVRATWCNVNSGNCSEAR